MQKERILTGTTGMIFLILWLVMLPATIRADYLRPGAPLREPTAHAQKASVVTAPQPDAVSKTALSYAVKPGDTLSEIAARYGVMVDQLVRANRLASPDNLAAGGNLVIPTTVPVTGNPLAGGVIHTLPWPVTGPVSSPFGWRTIFGRREFHTGVDIAVPLGTPIRTPLPGRVVFAAPLGTYGMAVIIDHGAGFSTLYAHAGRLLVSPGQAVAAGQAIALVGQTGDATGPHLHFETRVDGQPQNPLIYLAGR